MAHGVEIRVPFADTALLRTLAPVMPAMGAGAGKRALALAPGVKLPDAVLARAKTGFAIPTRAWLDMPAGKPTGTACRKG